MSIFIIGVTLDGVPHNESQEALQSVWLLLKGNLKIMWMTIK